MSITDSIFSNDLDIALRKQGFLVKERREIIKNYLLDKTIDRDSVLDAEERKAREVDRMMKERKNIPSEFEEQCNFVAWFKQTYPYIKIMSIRNHGFRTKKEKSEQLLEGLLKGAPDLYIPEWHCWIEFKKSKGGILSEKQAEFRDYAINVCGDDWFLAEGFEDGKSKIEQYVFSNNDYDIGN